MPERYVEDMHIVMDIFTPWLFMFGAFTVSLLSFALDFYTLESSYNWFGRSGALLVAAGTLNELKLAKHPRWFQQDILHLQHDHEGSTSGYGRFFRWSEKAKTIGWVFIGSGTLVWAYGDLVFANKTPF